MNRFLLVIMFPFVLCLGACQKTSGTYQGLLLSSDSIVLVEAGQKMQRLSPSGTLPKELYQADESQTVYPLPDGTGFFLMGEKKAVLVDGAQAYAPVVLPQEESLWVGAFIVPTGLVHTINQQGLIQSWQWEQKTTQVMLQRDSKEPLIHQGIFSADGNLVLTLYQKGGVAKLWDSNTGKFLFAFAGPTDAMSSAIWSADNKTLLLGSFDGTIWLWNQGNSLQSWNRVAQSAFHHKGVLSIAFAHQKPLFVTGDGEGAIRVWEYRLTSGTGIRLLQTYFPHQTAISSVQFSQDDQKIMALTALGSMVVQTSAEEPGFFLSNGTSTFLSGSLSSDAKWVVTTSPKGFYDAAIQLWKVEEIKIQSNAVKPVKIFPNSGIAPPIQAIFSPDDNWIVSGHQDGSIRVWDIRGREQNPWNIIPFFELQSVLVVPVQTLAISQDNQLLVVGGDDGKIEMYDFTDMNRGQRFAILTDHQAAVTSIAFSVDGRWMLTGSKDKQAILWQRQGFVPPVVVSSWKANAAINSVNFGALEVDGFGFLTSQDGFVQKLSFQDIQHPSLLKSWRAHGTEAKPASANTMAVNGQYLITGGADGNAFLWDVNTTAILSAWRLQNFSPFVPAVLQVAFSKVNNQVLINYGFDLEFFKLFSPEKIVQFQVDP